MKIKTFKAIILILIILTTLLLISCEKTPRNTNNGVTSIDLSERTFHKEYIDGAECIILYVREDNINNIYDIYLSDYSDDPNDAHEYKALNNNFDIEYSESEFKLEWYINNNSAIVYKMYITNNVRFQIINSEEYLEIKDLENLYKTP